MVGVFVAVATSVGVAVLPGGGGTVGVVGPCGGVAVTVPVEVGASVTVTPGVCFPVLLADVPVGFIAVVPPDAPPFASARNVTISTTISDTPAKISRMRRLSGRSGGCPDLDGGPGGVGGVTSRTGRVA